MFRRLALVFIGLACGVLPPRSAAEGGAEPPAVLPDREDWGIHAQMTSVTQYHPGFTAPYHGRNSLKSGDRADETVDLTLFGGVRLWRGGAFYVNPEIDQGFGLSDTLGLAGFSSGEAYKVGAAAPYFRLQRAFFRQVIGLGGAQRPLESAANRLPEARPADNVVITLGKFSVVDVFDTNPYAHDPRADFLNWSIIDAGAFDYAADAWGYSYGAAAEWTQSWWTVRAGIFDLSVVPNSTRLETDFSQYAVIGELEERHEILGRPGKLKLLGFANRGRMADYGNAVRFGRQTGAAPDVAAVRRYDSRPGVVLNLEQEITPQIGVFARASLNDGDKEAYEFTEINKSASAGLSVSGALWRRPDDTCGLAGVVNGLSRPARVYFAAGGLGILIGDGRLPHYGAEKILEAYYSARLIDHVTLAVDYQYIANPAYNRDRGPVSILGLRIHGEF